MTIRNPISAPQNVWSDTQQVDDVDLDLEQNFNTTIQSATIANHIGYGVIPEALVENVIFDSALSAGYLDGLAISAQNQPTDTNFGNQLAISLTGSMVGGRKTIKVGVIGLDFQSNLQYETFVFRANETQISIQHFTKILVLLFNDFIGDPTLSFNLGGHLVIQQSTPMILSRDSIMIAQNTQPNLFFRDFFLDGSFSLQTLLQNAMPLYNISALNINTQELGQQIISSGDVTTQIGEKFLATTNNIQKVTFLLSVQNLVFGQQNNLVWNGDLICSIYPLQSTVSCPTDIAPTTAIDFSPSNIPLAQISFNYNSLLATGVLLDGTPQPIDFIFSNSTVAGGNSIVPGSYYAVTLKRGGAANQCDIVIATGAPTAPNSQITTFAGTIWVDITDQQLWFEIWQDAAKVSDGQAYENGHGVIIPKTDLNTTTNTTQDYCLENIQFVGNEIYSAVLAAITVESDPVPDQRTGEPVNSEQQYEPQIQLLNSIDLTNLEAASEPLLLGTIQDKNIKFFNSLTSIINAKLYSATMAEDELLIRIVDNPTDTVRYDTSVIALQSSLLNGAFVGAQFFPDASSPSIYYRVADARLCSYIVGDVDGNGVIDYNDLNLLNSYLGYNMNVGLPLNTTITTDGYNYANVTNGYTTLIVPFQNEFGVEFQVVDGYGNIVADGYDGILVADPNDPRLANFTSASVMFNTIVGLTAYQVFLVTPTIAANYGSFVISSIDSVLDVITLQKVYLTGDVLGQMLRADIDGDFAITFNDGYLLDAYLAKQAVEPPTPYPSPDPGPTTNPYASIGTQFNVIRLRLEKFVDRTDDYSSTTPNRATAVHPAPDIFESDGYFYQHDFYHFPAVLSIVEQLTWNESLIVSNSNPKEVPCVFTSLGGFAPESCVIDGVTCSVYGAPPAFDKGLVNFFVPDNLIIGDGEIQRSNGDYYKVDFEVGTIVLEIPDGFFGAERTIDIMNDFIVDFNGNGITNLGFPAMRFADCSTVSKNALANDQVRFSVSVQSFSPNTNGLTTDGYTGVIVDGQIGVSVDYTTGLLTLNFNNLYQDPTLQTLSTKVQVNVFLKKGGFNNQTLFVNSDQMQNMLKLISVFSGANVGGASAFVDLVTDVTGVLPLIYGGTGAAGSGSLGVSGTVLTSNGTSVSYQFVVAPIVLYTPAVPSNWVSPAPTTVQGALDRMAALLFANFGPIPVNTPPLLLTFAILAGSGITNTGSSVITGNVGTFPTVTETGFPPGIIIGTNHFGDSVTQSAKTALTTAYNAAQALPGAVTIATDLNGQTLVPGVYSSLSGTFANSGTVTLNGAGNYTFQMATTLITSSSSTVLLTGGATAANVTWAVGSSATLGTTAHLEGSILALTSITATTGATVNGALLAQNGAVTLDANTVTLP